LGKKILSGGFWGNGGPLLALFFTLRAVILLRSGRQNSHMHALERKRIQNQEFAQELQQSSFDECFGKISR
jgi:hypothetical protein